MSTITSRQELLDLLAELDSREAIEDAAVGPAEQAAATPSARVLAAAAPTLPPLKLPKLSEKTLNGARIKELLEAGTQAARKGKSQRPALVLTTTGVRITPDLAKVADDADVIVLAQLREVRRAINIEGKTPLEVAQEILDRELEGLAADQRVSA